MEGRRQIKVCIALAYTLFREEDVNRKSLHMLDVKCRSPVLASRGALKHECSLKKPMELLPMSVFRSFVNQVEISSLVRRFNGAIFPGFYDIYTVLLIFYCF